MNYLGVDNMMFFFWTMVIFLTGVYSGIVLTDLFEITFYDDDNNDDDDDENF